MLIWFIYFCFGLAAQYELPIWLTSLLVVLVDRLVLASSRITDRKRETG